MNLQKLAILLLGLWPALGFAQVDTLALDQNWEFARKGSKTFRPATVPGTVQEELINADELLPPWQMESDPYYRDLEKESWVYRTRFSLDPAFLERDHIEFILAGIDVFGEIFLNGKKLPEETRNFFRTWSFHIEDLLQPGENILEIHLASTYKTGKKAYRKSPYELPAGNDDAKIRVSPYVRKPPYHFGWDWGPRVLTTGIWQTPLIVSYDQFRIEDCSFQLDSLSSDLAKYSVKLYSSFNLPSGSHVTIKNRKTGEVYSGTATPRRIQNKDWANDEWGFEFELKNPKLWWPRGEGEPYLYPLEIILSTHAEENIASFSYDLGVRQIQLIQEADGFGESFYFTVNGRPVFMRGANYIPTGHLLRDLTWKRKRMVLKSALEANMNMIRVWGGGMYESEKFYEFCDSAGLLVWQDLMFACGMYPADEGFRRNVEAEIRQQVRRIGHHPSVALFCGNNEMEVAWFNWGWQNQFKYSQKDSIRIWKNYQYLFHELAPDILQREAPGIPWLSSSPSSNWGKIEHFSRGNMHYWGVWHGGDSLEQYQDYVPRFMSEYGFQSWPGYNWVIPYTHASPDSISHPSLSFRQKSYKGNAPIEAEMKRRYGIPKTYRNYAYISQLIQADAYRIAIESHRRRKGFCMGTLFWQLNDCWPGPSWSALHVFGQRKAAFHTIKAAYEPVTVIPWLNPDSVFALTIVNDSTDIVTGTFIATLRDFSGNALFEVKGTLSALAGAKSTTPANQFAGLWEHVDPASTYLDIQYRSNDLSIRKPFFFAYPKDLKLPDPKITIEKVTRNNRPALIISTDKLALGVDIRPHYGEQILSENFFTLYPGEEKLVWVSALHETTETLMLYWEVAGFRYSHLQQILTEIKENR